jgi:hypothetical protein
MREDDFFCGKEEHNLFSTEGEVNSFVIDAEEDYWEVYTDIWKWCPFCDLDRTRNGGFSCSGSPALLHTFQCDNCSRKISWIHERELRFS